MVINDIQHKWCLSIHRRVKVMVYDTAVHKTSSYKIKIMVEIT